MAQGSRFTRITSTQITRLKDYLFSPQNFYPYYTVTMHCTFECGSQRWLFQSSRCGPSARGVAGQSHMTVGATNEPLHERPAALAPGVGDPLPHQTTNHYVPGDLTCATLLNKNASTPHTRITPRAWRLVHIVTNNTCTIL